MVPRLGAKAIDAHRNRMQNTSIGAPPKTKVPCGPRQCLCFVHLCGEKRFPDRGNDPICDRL